MIVCPIVGPLSWAAAWVCVVDVPFEESWLGAFGSVEGLGVCAVVVVPVLLEEFCEEEGDAEFENEELPNDDEDEEFSEFPNGEEGGAPPRAPAKPVGAGAPKKKAFLFSLKLPISCPFGPTQMSRHEPSTLFIGSL